MCILHTRWYIKGSSLVEMSNWRFQRQKYVEPTSNEEILGSVTYEPAKLVVLSWKKPWKPVYYITTVVEDTFEREDETIPAYFSVYQ